MGSYLDLRSELGSNTKKQEDQDKLKIIAANFASHLQALEGLQTTLNNWHLKNQVQAGQTAATPTNTSESEIITKRKQLNIWHSHIQFLSQSIQAIQKEYKTRALTQEEIEMFVAFEKGALESFNILKRSVESLTNPDQAPVDIAQTLNTAQNLLNLLNELDKQVYSSSKMKRVGRVIGTVLLTLLFTSLIIAAIVLLTHPFTAAITWSAIGAAFIGFGKGFVSALQIKFFTDKMPVEMHLLHKKMVWTSDTPVMYTLMSLLQVIITPLFMYKFAKKIMMPQKENIMQDAQTANFGILVQKLRENINIKTDLALSGDAKQLSSVVSNALQKIIDLAEKMYLENSDNQLDRSSAAKGKLILKAIAFILADLEKAPTTTRIASLEELKSYNLADNTTFGDLIEAQRNAPTRWLKTQTATVKGLLASSLWAPSDNPKSVAFEEVERPLSTKFAASAA